MMNSQETSIVEGVEEAQEVQGLGVQEEQEAEVKAKAENPEEDLQDHQDQVMCQEIRDLVRSSQVNPGLHPFSQNRVVCRTYINFLVNVFIHSKTLNISPGLIGI